MKKSVVYYLVAKILQIEALLLMLPVLVGVLYRESSRVIISYGIVAIVLGIGSSYFCRNQHQNFKIRSRDGFVSVALSWVILSFFGGLPLYFTGEVPNVVDAFFEIASGFTTTGSSILPSVEGLSHATLFWRSFSHFVGGMGVLVFTLILLPNSSEFVQLMRAEVPGPVFGKLLPKVKETAKILYKIYTVMTIALAFILWFAKVPFFEALLLAFGTAGTGGFSVNANGFEAYANPALVEWIIGVGMVVFGINFNIYYYSLIGSLKDVLKKDEELHSYIGIIVVAIVLICVNVSHYYDQFSLMIRHVFFTVASIMTTTGYGTADFDTWPLFSHIMLILLMFIGGCAGSTAGGLKVSRVLMYVKSSFAELKRVGQPRRKIVPMFSGKPIDATVEAQVGNYLFVYILVFIVVLVSVSYETQDFATAFSSVAATINNIGPGLGQVGPTQNFAFYSNWNTLVLTFSMLAGRLEILPIILLFSPKTLKAFAKKDATA